MPNSNAVSPRALPRIDIVTVCKDAAPLVEKTLLSVTTQSLRPHRYVVIDGGSTDGTNEIIARYSHAISSFITEPDNGIGHAMNKGLALCDGDYVLFLHAGDYLIDSTKLLEAATVLSNLKPAILSCPVILEAGDRQTLAKPRGFNKWMLLKTGVPHQGAFISRRIFSELGGFDEELQVAMDYEFFLRCYRHRTSIRCHSTPLTAMAGGGISWRRDWPSLKARLNEERMIHFRRATTPLATFVYHVYWILYPIYKRFAKH